MKEMSWEPNDIIQLKNDISWIDLTWVCRTSGGCGLLNRTMLSTILLKEGRVICNKCGRSWKIDLKELKKEIGKLFKKNGF